MTKKWARAALSHPAFTGVSRQHLGGLIEELAEPWSARRESDLHQRRGRARQRAAGAGPKHELVFTDRVVITLVHLRTGLPHIALAELYRGAAPRCAYEGAAMACTIRDAMAGGRGHRTRDLLLGPGQPHIFLTYIGIGFAMSHLPRPLWRNVLPDLTGSAFYPTMSWFAVDGYGFDLAYFATRRWVDRQRAPKPYPWDGSPEYFRRAVDFGVGRALWFIHCGQPAQTAAAVRRFDARRHADLFSGVGLAATFAGGCDARELGVLLDGAGEHRAEVGLGAVLAVKGRHFSGHVPAYTEAAAKVLTELSVDQAVDLADRTEVAYGDGTPAEPAYELWRRRIREHFVTAAAGTGAGGR